MAEVGQYSTNWEDWKTIPHTLLRPLQTHQDSSSSLELKDI